jgi:O-antigen ligase
MLRFKILEEKIIAYLVCSIVPFLALSIFFADLICSVLSLFFLFYLIKKSSIFFYKNVFFILVLCFYILCLISSSLSGEIFFSLKSSLPLIRIIILIFLISYLINNNKYFLNIFYNFLKYTFLILIFYGLAQYAYKYYLLSSVGSLDTAHVRLTLPFSDEGKLGSFLVRLYGLLIASYILVKNHKKSENIILILLSLLMSAVILLSGERSSLFFLILTFSIYFLCLNFSFKLKVYFLLSFFIVLLLFLSQNSNLSKRVLFDPNNKISLKTEQGDLIIFTNQHTAHYLSGLKMFQDKPIIGQGPRMFRLLCNTGDFRVRVKDKKSCSSHPHNTYIQLLAETGFIGALLFSLGFFHIIFNLLKHLIKKFFFRKNKLSNYQIILSVSALLVFWPFSPSGNFFNNWILIIYTFPVSFYFNEFFKYNIFGKN